MINLKKIKSNTNITYGTPITIGGWDTVTDLPVIRAINNINDTCYGLTVRSLTSNVYSDSIITLGTINYIDTSSFQVGDKVYPTTSGTLTNNLYSGLSQEIGIVRKSHATLGRIFLLNSYNTVSSILSPDYCIGTGPGPVPIQTSTGQTTKAIKNSIIVMVDYQNIHPTDLTFTTDSNDLVTAVDGTFPTDSVIYIQYLRSR